MKFGSQKGSQKAPKIDLKNDAIFDRCKNRFFFIFGSQMEPPWPPFGLPFWRVAFPWFLKDVLNETPTFALRRWVENGSDKHRNFETLLSARKSEKVFQKELPRTPIFGSILIRKINENFGTPKKALRTVSASPKRPPRSNADPTDPRPRSWKLAFRWSWRAPKLKLPAPSPWGTPKRARGS